MYLSAHALDVKGQYAQRREAAPAPLTRVGNDVLVKHIHLHLQSNKRAATQQSRAVEM